MLSFEKLKVVGVAELVRRHFAVMTTADDAVARSASAAVFCQFQLSQETRYYP